VRAVEPSTKQCSDDVFLWFSDPDRNLISFVAFQRLPCGSAANFGARGQGRASVIEGLTGGTDDVNGETISVIYAQESADLFGHLKSSFAFVHRGHERCG
jgi:hypothetical protein